MTALKPLDDRRVRGVPAKRYPLNRTCAHPECTRKDVTAHHIFPKSQIGNSSWFVEVGDRAAKPQPPSYISADAIPHVIGLCGHGTGGHHGDIEAHRAWIKYEDGEFVWYERVDANDGPGVEKPGWVIGDGDWWRALGPLNPQPHIVSPKHKRGKNKQGEERRKRRRISVAVPDDSEDGGGLWDETQEEIKAALIKDGLYDEGDKIPAYEAWMAQARDWLDRRGS